MRVSVIGAHLPRLTPNRMSKWIADAVDGFREVMTESVQSGVFKSWTLEQIALRAEELPDEYVSALRGVALFEIRVEQCEGVFDFMQFSEQLTTSVAWEPVLLTVDGEATIETKATVPAELSAFRAAFFIHDWPENGTLLGPTGPLLVPEFTPVPERLWKLAPYELLD